MRLSFCAACGVERDLQDHHLVPRAAGGSDDLANIITLCTPCHWRVHDLSWPPNTNHSELTRKGQAAARARGVKIGGDRGAKITREMVKAAVAARQEKARARTADLAPIVQELQAAGSVSLRAIAAGLDQRGIPAAKGGKWSANQVSRLLEAAAILFGASGVG
jgi:hypothetical protein